MNHKTLRLALAAGLSIITVSLGTAQERPVAAPSESPTVTLQDAIDLALRNYPTVVQGQTQVRIARAAQRVVLASWLPTASLNSSVSKSPTERYNTLTGEFRTVYTIRLNPSTGSLDTLITPYNGSIGFTANIVVWDWGQRLLDGRRTGANATSAEASLVSTKFAVTLQTKQAFFGALAQAELERVQQTSVQRAQEQLKIAKEKLAAGSAVRSDTLSATVAVGQARLALLNAQTSRATQEATLARLVGFDRPVRPIADSSVIAIVEIDTTGIRAEAMHNSPAVATADAQQRAAQATVNSARVVYLPSISAGYSNSRNGASVTAASAYSSLVPTWGLSVSMSWPLFNGLRREQTLWNAAANRDAAEANAADARRNVNAQVTQYLAALQAALTRSMIARASREAADEALRVQRERYRLGAATLVEVLAAQQNLEQAEVDGVNARVDYQVAKANLSALVGREL